MAVTVVDLWYPTNDIFQMVYYVWSISIVTILQNMWFSPQDFFKLLSFIVISKLSDHEYAVLLGGV